MFACWCCSLIGYRAHGTQCAVQSFPVIKYFDVIKEINTMLEQPLVLDQWDDQLWCLMTEKAVISSDGTVTFTFRGGNSITVGMG